MSRLTSAILLALLAASTSACATPVSAYHQRCLECALRRTADPSDLPEAHRYFTEGCLDGDARSCSILGVMYENGRGVAADPHRAMSLYRLACLDGNAEGCVNLGRLIESGDRAGARAAYQVACASKSAEGCRRLAAVPVP